MEKYLQLLLKEVNTVIIPGLGALTITNYKTGEIMFMPYLKYDDGKLSSFIKGKGELSEEEAKNLISEKVQSILNAVESGSNASLNGLGVFSKDNSGDIIFTSDSLENTIQTESIISAQLEEVVVNETPVPTLEIVEPVCELEPISIPVEEVVTSPIEIEEEVIEVVEPVVIIEEVFEKKEEVISSPIEEEIVEVESVDEDVVEESSSTVSEQEIEKEITQPIVSTIKEKEEIAPEILKEESEEDSNFIDDSESDHDLVVVKKKRGVGFFIKIVLLITVIGGGILVGINFKNIQEHIPFLAHHKVVSEEEKMISKLESDKTKPTSNDEVKSEELIETPAETPVESTNNTIVKEEKSSSNHSSTSHSSTNLNEPLDIKQTFYIVLGSFSNKSNADRSVSKLISEGKSSASTVERDGKYLVTISNYSNIDDANSGLKSVKETFSKAWILKP